MCKLRNSGCDIHCKFQGVESAPKVLFCRKKRRQNNTFGADSTP